jgi:hypothetical protein
VQLEPLPLRLSTDQSSSAASSLAADGGRRAAAAAAASDPDLIRRASKALLRQVEETRRKYAVEAEGLKAEVGLLQKERRRHERDAELAGVAAKAATKAAADATDELERVNAQLQEARDTLKEINGCGRGGWAALRRKVRCRGFACKGCNHKHTAAAPALPEPRHSPNASPMARITHTTGKSRQSESEALRLAKQRRELQAAAKEEVRRLTSAANATAAAGATDLEEQRAAVAAVRSAAAEQARVLDEERRDLALQRAEFERQLEAFQAQVCRGRGFRQGWQTLGVTGQRGAEALLLGCKHPSIGSGCVTRPFTWGCDRANTLQVRHATASLAEREARVKEGEEFARQQVEREAALAAQEAAVQEARQQAEAARAAIAQRQQQLDELYTRVKGDSEQLRDQAEGFEARRAGIMADLQVQQGRRRARDEGLTWRMTALSNSSSGNIACRCRSCDASHRSCHQDRESALHSQAAELVVAQERLAEERARAAAEAMRAEERAREGLRVVREAEEDYLAGRDRLAALEREVR